MNESDNHVALEPATPPAAPAPPLARRTPPPVSAAAEPSAELRDRVKKLRIGGPGEGGSKGSALGRAAWLPWLLCAALALTWGGVALRTYKNAPTKEEGGGIVSESGGSGSPGSTGGSGSGNPAAPTGAIKVEGKGYLIAVRQISVSPIDVGGKVIQLRGPVREADGAVLGGVAVLAPVQPFEEGALYRKGDVIAVLDSAAYQAQVNEALASLASAEQRVAAAVQRRDAQLPASVRKVELDQVEAQLKEAQANKLRAEQELKRMEGLGPSAGVKELQQAQADAATSAAKVSNLQATLVILKEGPRKETLAALEADVKSADADVAAAAARLVSAQWRLDNCTIRAPVSGTVLTKAAEVGKLVNPMAFSGGGAICDLADLADLEADLKIAERDIAKIREGMACTIRPDAYPDRVYSGVVRRKMPIANRADNTFNVRVQVKLFEGEVPGTYLKPEMGAVVSIRE